MREREREIEKERKSKRERERGSEKGTAECCDKELQGQVDYHDVLNYYNVYNSL